MIKEIEKTIGCGLVMFGMCAMDSRSLALPVAIMLIGAGITYIGLKPKRGLHFVG